MPLFRIKYSLLDGGRVDAMAAFAVMTEAEDAAATQDAGVRVLGRWSAVGGARGVCVCEARDACALYGWLVRWAPVADIEAAPVVDDNAARAIALGADRPPFFVEYPADRQAKDGESLYVVEYRFHEHSRAEGLRAFASMTEAEDKADAGANVCLGRWHDLGTGTGLAVCLAASSEALQAWAHRWMPLCDCAIQPVVVDADARARIQTAPWFAAARAKARGGGWFGLGR